MPFPLQLVLVFAVGTALGALINLAIYRFAYFNPRLISPWGAQPENAKPRKWFDFIPVIGWFGRKRDEEIHGVGFWSRPAAIELFFGAAAVGFYLWQFEFGLSSPARWPTIENQWVWLSFHGFLIVLLTIATFIDFDEKIIPDQITVTGTIFALVFAACVPISRLPLAASGEYLHFDSPVRAIPEWASGPNGLTVAIASLALWCFALVPKFNRIRFGKYGTFRFLWANMVRPKRKTKGKIEGQQRGMFGITRFCIAIFILGAPATYFVWDFVGGVYWESLFCSLLGMVFGLIFVWLIRIIATFALAKEAMGFGDVTLMAMIGAFLGWQPALLTFAFAPFAAVFIAIGQFVASKKHDIAFGPYLSLAAIVVVIGWPSVWGWASQQIFAVGNGIILAIIGVSLVLMFAMLAGFSRLRG